MNDMAVLRILSTTCVFFGILVFVAVITGYAGADLFQAFLLVVGGVLLEAIDRMVKSLNGIHEELKKLSGSEGEANE